MESIWASMEMMLKHDHTRRRNFEDFKKYVREHDITFKDFPEAVEYFHKLEDGDMLNGALFRPSKSTPPFYANVRLLVPCNSSTASTSFPRSTSTPQSDTHEMKCKVCLDAQIEMLIVPCGHAALCRSCSSHLADCPICRTKIEQMVKVQW